MIDLTLYKSLPVNEEFAEYMNKLFEVAKEKYLESKKSIFHADIAMSVAPYEGDNKPDYKYWSSLEPFLKEDIFPMLEYPEEKSEEMMVITNIQVIIQEELYKLD